MEDELESVKEVIFAKEYSDIEWMTPITEDHIVKIAMYGKEKPNWSYMKRWCEQNCDDTVVIWTGGTKHILFHFFRQTDAVAFKLRWT